MKQSVCQVECLVLVRLVPVFYAVFLCFPMSRAVPACFYVKELPHIVLDLSRPAWARPRGTTRFTIDGSRFLPGPSARSLEKTGATPWTCQRPRGRLSHGGPEANSGRRQRKSLRLPLSWRCRSSTGVHETSAGKAARVPECMLPCLPPLPRTTARRATASAPFAAKPPPGSGEYRRPRRRQRKTARRNRAAGAIPLRAAAGRRFARARAEKGRATAPPRFPFVQQARPAAPPPRGASGPRGYT